MLAVASACSGSSNESSPRDPADLPTRPGEEQPDFANVPADPLAGLPGQLAIVDGGSVIVTRPNGSDPRIIDGGGYTTSFLPVWGPGGSKLAWVTITDTEALIKDSVLESDLTNETSVGTMVPLYLQWHPEGETVAYLRQNPFGPEFEVGTVKPGEPKEALAVAQPFYYSFSPDGESIAAHMDANRVVLITDGVTRVLTETEGTFSAPAWLDSDHLLVHINGALTSLDINDLSEEVIVEVEGATEFVLGPGGAFLAYLAGPPDLMEVQLDDDRPTSTLRVIEVETGIEDVVTDLPVGAFEWSPNGLALAWLEFPEDPVVGQTRWHYWAGAEIGVSPQYIPSSEMSNEYLPFYAQFAQSNTGWSPGAEAFAFAGTIDEETGVWIQVMDPTADPIRIGFGSAVFWSPDGSVAPSGPSPA